MKRRKQKRIPYNVNILPKHKYNMHKRLTPTSSVEDIILYDNKVEKIS